MPTDDLDTTNTTPRNKDRSWIILAVFAIVSIITSLILLFGDHG